MRPARLFFVCLLFCVLQARSQNEWSVWPGIPNGLRFTANGPTIINTPTYQADPIKYVGGGITYCDPQSGKELFTATSRFVYTADYRLMENAQAFISCSENRYGVQVVPFSDGSNRFYIFHAFPETGILLGQQTGLQTRCSVYGQANRVTSGLRYSILDMNANGGRGRVVAQNEWLNGNLVDRIALVRHANGRDTWLLLHSWGSNAFVSHLVTDAGIQPGIVSNIGPVFSGDYTRSVGEIDASPNGKMIAATSTGSDLLELYDFDPNTGLLSNYRTVDIPGQPGSVCFSPDNTKLYVGSAETLNCGYRSRLFQIDLTETDLQKSLFQVYDGGGAEQINTQMARALDGKIYLAGKLVYSDTEPTRSALYRIEFPNQPKNACLLRKEVWATSYLAYFPNLVNNYVHQTQPETPVQRLAMPEQVTACLGAFTLSAPAGFATYRWSNGATTQSITVQEPGTYSVLAGPAGFIKPAAYGFTELRSVAKPISFGKDTTLCPNSTFRLSIPLNYRNVLWSDGDTSHFRLVPQPGGKQRVTALDENGCTTQDSICVFYKADPRAAFGKDTTLCRGQELTLTMEPSQTFTQKPVTYSWQDGSSGQTLQVKKPGLYWGKVTYDGCSVTDTIKVDYLDGAGFSLGADTVLCTGDLLLLKADMPGARYQWSDGSIQDKLVVKTAGTYWVKVDNGRCTMADTIQVQFRARPLLDLGRDTVVCSGTAYTIRSGYNTGNFLWQDGSTGSDFTAKGPGMYRLQYSGEGCAVADSIRISWKDAPQLSLGNDTVLCEGSVLVLQAPPDFDHYRWQDGSSGQSLRITRAGTYILSASAQGCTRTDTIHIGFSLLPRFSLGNDTVLCDGLPIRLDPDFTGIAYKWQDGSASPVYTAERPGQYTLAITNNCGTTSDTININAGLCSLVMPNAFTPNNDGVNDVFRVKYPQFLRTFSIQIFNRWGVQVYHSSNAGQGWDGRYNGKEQPNGNYIYLIEATDKEGKKMQLKGNVVLVR